MLLNYALTGPDMIISYTDRLYVPYERSMLALVYGSSWYWKADNNSKQITVVFSLASSLIFAFLSYIDADSESFHQEEWGGGVRYKIYPPPLFNAVKSVFMDDIEEVC